MRGMANGSHHVIGLYKIVTDMVRETAERIFPEIGTVSMDSDRFDLATTALEVQMSQWISEVRQSSKRLQNQTLLNQAIDPLVTQANSDVLTIADLARQSASADILKQNDYLTLWLEDQKILLLRKIKRELKALYAKLSAAGTLRSGYRIKKAIEIWESNTKDYSTDAIAKGKELGCKSDDHQLISLEIMSILSEFEAALPDIVVFPKGAENSRDDSSRRAAQKLFETIKFDIEREIQLSALEFEADKSPLEPIASAAEKEAHNKTSGKSFGKLPRLSNVALNGWWDGLSPETRSLPQNELLAIAKSTFPAKFIARDRIRELTGPRKRGKKPNSGKTPAN